MSTRWCWCGDRAYHKGDLCDRHHWWSRMAFKPRRLGGRKDS